MTSLKIPSQVSSFCTYSVYTFYTKQKQCTTPDKETKKLTIGVIDFCHMLATGNNVRYRILMKSSRTYHNNDDYDTFGMKLRLGFANDKHLTNTELLNKLQADFLKNLTENHIT